MNDRRVLNGIFWVLRSGAHWRGLPDQPLSDRREEELRENSEMVDRQPH